MWMSCVLMRVGMLSRVDVLAGILPLLRFIFTAFKVQTAKKKIPTCIWNAPEILHLQVRALKNTRVAGSSWTSLRWFSLRTSPFLSSVCRPVKTVSHVQCLTSKRQWSRLTVFQWGMLSVLMVLISYRGTEGRISRCFQHWPNCFWYSDMWAGFTWQKLSLLQSHFSVSSSSFQSSLHPFSLCCSSSSTPPYLPSFIPSILHSLFPSYLSSLQVQQCNKWPVMKEPDGCVGSLLCPGQFSA